MEAIIRKATIHDFPAVYSLIKEFAVFQKTTGKVTITLEDMMQNKALFQCFVAEINNEIAGFASFYFAYYSWTGKALYLDDLYVTERYRKTGIGKKLLDKIIEPGKRGAMYKRRWQVSGWNAAAIKFYKKTDAVIDDTEINCNLIIKTEQP